MPEPRTIAEAILRVAADYPENGFTFQDQDGRETRYSFPEVEAETARRASGLQKLGLRRGDRVALVIAEPEQFVLTFLASVRAGVSPIPVFPPLQVGSLGAYPMQAGRIIRSAQARVVIVSQKLATVGEALAAMAPHVEATGTAESLSIDARPDLPLVGPDDPAFVQYTSGSTTEPRGVSVSHRALLANIRGILESGLAVDPARDKGVTWLPLYHDMGLVGFVLGPAAWGVSVVFIPTTRFIRNPVIWLDAIHRHRATISFAPNFAYSLAVAKSKASDLERWDLSCVRAFGCGAEPIQPEIMREFQRTFARCKLPENALHPAYGLAEATLAVAMKRVGDSFSTRSVNAARFREERLAVPNLDGEPVIEHVSCGAPLPGQDVAIMDATGKTLPENVEGEIWVRGLSIARSADANGDGAVRFRSDGWLCTGDLGYLSGGELFVTGRLKDVIILHGRNLHPQMIEWAVGQLEGVRAGSVAAFGRQGRDSEELVVVVETRTAPGPQMLAAIRSAVQAAVSASPGDIVCVRHGTLPKTSSGKLKRHEVRQRYAENRFGSQAWDATGGSRLPVARRQTPGTIIDILRNNSTQQPDQVAYTFLHRETHADVVTYAQLDVRVNALAAWLTEESQRGQRAVLVYPAGLEFIFALYACMASGVIPIPAYPLIGSRPARGIARILHVARDAGCTLILSTAEMLPKLREHLAPEMADVTFLATDQVRAEDPQWQPTPLDANALALLQYTSGSTSSPRGVKITHANLMANTAAIRECYQYNSDTRGVSWLPPYHDMGLIGGILLPLYAGIPMTLMSPVAFLQSPLRWLETISATRATSSPSPNFGYDLCAQKATPEAIEQLDLSSWETAICGAEPVSKPTLERFAEKFRAAGFRRSAFCPSYGLAEATLLVTASRTREAPVYETFDRRALEMGQIAAREGERARILVGNGQPARGTTVRIVDPATRQVCAPARVGEIWISGPGVACGYWRKPELNDSLFRAFTRDGEGPFLRTGDTGFMHDGSLFVTGRLKNLIILGGRNHYLEDLELVVAESHDAIKGVPAAVFALDDDEREMLVVLQEVKRQTMKSSLDPQEVFRGIHRALFSDDVRADAILLLKPGAIPRTSSGKVQRHACRSAFLDGSLDVWAEWVGARAEQVRIGAREAGSMS